MDDYTYTAYLERTYGIPGRQQTPDTYTDGADSWATTSVATHDQQPAAPLPPVRPMTAAERLSRNRQAKRAVTDTTMIDHLSTMYHMHRRIAESYAKSGLLQRSGGGSSGNRAGSRPSTAPARPATAPSRGCAYTAPAAARGAMARAGTLPPRSAGLVAAAAEAADVIAAHRPAAAAAPEAPSFVRRHVANTRAALKAAILDEIVEHRVYEGARLRALFRGYLKLNAGEAFYPTLQDVIAELRLELGVD